MKIKGIKLNRQYRGCRLVEGYLKAGGKPTARKLTKLINAYGTDANCCWRKTDAYQLGRLVGRQGLI